jgi:dTDP-glucose pyrophosphorylase
MEREALKQILITPETPMLEVMARINQGALGIALVVDGAGRLLDTVTDGDLRRAILDGVDLKQPVSVLRERRRQAPLTASVGAPPAELLRTMRQRRIRQLPLLNADGSVADLALLDDLSGTDEVSRLHAVVMAGGFGSRLMPLTSELPKPMLPVGERPLVEHTVEKLRAAGIKRVYMTTHYKAEALTQHFGDGKEFGVDIEYVDEAVPLGTAGALGRLNGAQEPLLVINGDVMTDLNFRSLLHFHREHQAEMTVGVRQFEFSVPYGVVATCDAQVTGITEKPTQRMFVNAGIYLLEPQVCKQVPQDVRFDMTDLIAKLIAGGRRVLAFPISEYWVDVGRPDDYAKAQARAAAEGAGR